MLSTPLPGRNHPFIDKPDGYNWARWAKRTTIKPGLETVSQQHAAHAQKRSHSIQAESFKSSPKSSKRKKGSAGRFGIYEMYASRIWSFYC